MVTYLFYYTELEALEACYWLKAAGFPQYAQSYEGIYVNDNVFNTLSMM